MSIYQWSEYARNAMNPMELVPSTINQKKMVGEGYDGGFVDFSNMGPSQQGVMPNTQAFLVESIKIFGITQELLTAGVSIIVGYKYYIYKTPAWLFQIRPGFNGQLHQLPFMLPPLTYFSMRLDYEGPVHPRLVEAVWIGKLLRPIQ